jgi:hypothetical protein
MRAPRSWLLPPTWQPYARRAQFLVVGRHLTLRVGDVEDVAVLARSDVAALRRWLEAIERDAGETSSGRTDAGG